MVAIGDSVATKAQRSPLQAWRSKNDDRRNQQIAERHVTEPKSRMLANSPFQIWRTCQWQATTWLQRAVNGNWWQSPLVIDQLSSNSLLSQDAIRWEVQARNSVSVRVCYLRFAPRKRLFLKTYISVTTRRGLRLLHCSCSKWKRPYDRSGRCFVQGLAVQCWTASAVISCLTPYKLAERKVRDLRSL